MKAGSYTIFNQLLYSKRGFGGEALSRRKQGGLGADLPALGDFERFTTKMIHF